MTTIVFPVKAKYASSIIGGDKKVEFRRKCARRVLADWLQGIPVDALFYETANTGWGAVVATGRIKFVTADKPSRIWTLLHDVSGMGEREFFRYFEGCAVSWAYGIEDVQQLPEPVPLSEYGIDAVPQSFRYLKEDK